MCDGRVARSFTPAVSDSVSLNVNIACSCSDHMNHSKECACKHEDDGRMFWILDSGASTHFTLHHSDFVDYVELKGDDHIPIQTAGGVIHVTGCGHMLIQWMDHVHRKSHLLDLHGACHIPNSGVCLISLGQLLNHGAKVQGDMHQINMLYGDSILLAPFTPGRLGSNMYTLESLPLKGLTMTCTLTYDIVHCRLGHPSKEVIHHARKHMRNFPDVEIPNMDSICPGCAMSKLPNRSFPPSERCTTCAFKLIHLDIKSFPTESYHRYRYIITFVDDYTSMAWTTPLCTKDAALVATHHFLKMVSTQLKTQVEQWMSNAGEEYKSKAFDSMLKEQGIRILQSASHTPQQNGHAEQFMRTVMDKSEAMHHEACIPESWWEFSIAHATHVYNRTPLCHHNW